MHKSPLTHRHPSGALWAFALSALAAFFSLLPAMAPYGGMFVTRGDYLEQQIPFILETRRVLLSGTPYWSWNTFLGANFIGSYSFYTIGSPFVWPLILLPEAAIPYGISVMAVLKHAVCGLSSYLYLHKMVKDERSSLIGALLYTFSSFTVINTQFYHFTEVIAFFPLILLGLENAYSPQRKHGALALACALNALCNYYFMAGTALFTALYFICRFFSADWRGRRRLGRTVSVVFECGLGCLMASILLVPSAWALLSFTRANGVGMDLFQRFSLSDVLERLRVLLMPIESNTLNAFYGDAANWSSVAAYLPVTGCVLVGLYFLRHGWNWLKTLLATLIVISFVPVLNGLFTLGSNVEYTRWWYALTLMMALATAYVLARPDARDRYQRPVLIACLALAALLTLPCLIPHWLLADWYDGENALLVQFAIFFYRQQYHSAYAPAIFRVLALALAALNYGVLWAFGGKRRSSKAFIAALLAVIVVNYASYIAVNDRFVLSGGEQANDGTVSMDEIARRELLDAHPEHADTEYAYRIDHSGIVRNYSMIVNEPSLTSFHSLRSGYLREFVYSAGFGFDESTTVRPQDEDGALRSFLSVKYYYNLDEENQPGAPEGFTFLRREGDVAIYENENYVPMGFIYDTYTDVYDQRLEPDTTAEVMLNAVVLRGTQIGTLSKMTPKRLSDQPARTWQAAAAELRENACDSFVGTPAGFKAHIDAKRDGILCFTVPYDKGWSATVNGSPADILNLNLAFMGIPVFEGEYDIEFTYEVRGLKMGALTSLGAAGIFIIYAGLYARRRRRRGSGAV